MIRFYGKKKGVVTSAPSERKAKRRGRQVAGRLPEGPLGEPPGASLHHNLEAMKAGERGDLARVDREEQLRCAELKKELAEHRRAQDLARARREAAEFKAGAAAVAREKLAPPRFGPVISKFWFFLITGVLIAVDVPLTMLGLVHLTLPHWGVFFLTIGIGAVIVAAADGLGIVTGKLVAESGPGNSEQTETVLRFAIFVGAGLLMLLLVGFNFWRYANFANDIGVPTVAATVTLFALQLVVAGAAWWLGLAYHDTAAHRDFADEVAEYEAEAAEAQDEEEDEDVAAAGYDDQIAERVNAAASERELLKELWASRAWSWVAGAADRRPDLTEHFRAQHSALWPSSASQSSHTLRAA